MLALLSRYRKTWKDWLARIAIALFAAGCVYAVRPTAVTSLVTRASGSLRLEYTIHVASPGLIRDYVASTQVRKLQLGAGGVHYDGWLSTDIEPVANEAFLDATQPFPFPDGSFRYIFSEHVIEHLPYESALAMLRECHRVLEPGGRLRIATPDLERFLALFAKERSPELEEYISGKLRWHRWPESIDPASIILNGEMHDFGHAFLYTPQLLRRSLEQTGFTEIREYAPGESDDLEMRNRESRALHSSPMLVKLSAYETMVLEAVR
jgi:predicted SAM-dependent methyltransferase